MVLNRTRDFSKRDLHIKGFVRMYGYNGCMTIGDFKLDLDPRDNFLSVNGDSYYALSMTEKMDLEDEMEKYSTPHYNPWLGR